MSTELNESISAIFVRPISFKVGIKLDTWTTFTEKILTQTNKFQFDAVVQTSQSKISPRSKNCPIFTLHSTHFISLAREHQVEQICSILCLSNWFQIKATVFFLRWLWTCFTFLFMFTKIHRITLISPLCMFYTTFDTTISRRLRKGWKRRLKLPERRVFSNISQILEWEIRGNEVLVFLTMAEQSIAKCNRR